MAPPSHDPNRRFGCIIRQHRTARGLSQEVLAERAGLSVDAVRRIERGKMSPSLNTLVRLARGLDMGVATLVAGLDGALDTTANEIRDLALTRTERERLTLLRVARAMWEEDETKG